MKYKLNLDEINVRRNNLLTMRIDDLINSIIPNDITNALNNSESFDIIFYQLENLSKNSMQKDRVYLFGNEIFLNFLFLGGKKNRERIKVFFREDMNLENVGIYYDSEPSVFEKNKNCDDFEEERCKEIANIVSNNKKNFQDLFFSFENSPF